MQKALVLLPRFGEDVSYLQAMRLIQQHATLQMTADLIGRATHCAISLEEALQWTVHEFATVHYKAGSLIRKEMLNQRQRSLIKSKGCLKRPNMQLPACSLFRTDRLSSVEKPNTAVHPGPWRSFACSSTIK